MNLEFVVALVTLLLIGAAMIFLSRANLLLFLLLPASQMLGFVDPMTFAIKGLFDIHALFILLNLGALILSVDRINDLRSALFLRPMIILGILWLYGVVYPVMADKSSLFYSIKASKEFMTLFSYFSVYVFLRKAKDVNRCWKYITWLGLYYSVFEITAQVLGDSFLQKSVYDIRKEVFVFWKVYIPFWPVIVISFFNTFFLFLLAAPGQIIRAFVLGIGILLTFYRSYLMATLATIPAIMLFAKQSMRRVAAQGVAIAGIFATVFVAIGLMAGSDAVGFEKISEAFLFSGVREFTTQSGGALAGREVFAKERRDILQQSPYLGFGFIDKDSKFGLESRTYIKGDLLGFIDKGDLDVALKFGYIGGFVLYANFLYIAFLCIRLARQKIDKLLTVHAMAVAATIIVFLCVQPVHATFTNSFALFPLALALGLLERERANVVASKGDIDIAHVAHN
ncbi:hypothetical protein [Methylocaldum sp. GT1BB]|jgi:hypothetical protein|uniref:hypothetical protein n=1 Tax=Methylocaldum sp. GT1BB TaxID=3438963 RepID=UPI003D9FFC07